MVLMIFYLFNVNILVIPGHTTHVLQPFDVGIAAPLKTEFKQQLKQEINLLAAELTGRQRTKANALRCHMVAPVDPLDPVNSPTMRRRKSSREPDRRRPSTA
jgi:hypothetical protein